MASIELCLVDCHILLTRGYISGLLDSYLPKMFFPRKLFFGTLVPPQNLHSLFIKLYNAHHFLREVCMRRNTLGGKGVVRGTMWDLTSWPNDIATLWRKNVNFGVFWPLWPCFSTDLIQILQALTWDGCIVSCENKCHGVRNAATQCCNKYRF